MKRGGGCEKWRRGVMVYIHIAWEKLVSICMYILLYIYMLNNHSCNAMNWPDLSALRAKLSKAYTKVGRTTVAAVVSWELWWGRERERERDTKLLIVCMFNSFVHSLSPRGVLDWLWRRKICVRGHSSECNVGVLWCAVHLLMVWWRSDRMPPSTVPDPSLWVWVRTIKSTFFFFSLPLGLVYWFKVEVVVLVEVGFKIAWGCSWEHGKRVI